MLATEHWAHSTSLSSMWQWKQSRNDNIINDKWLHRMTQWTTIMSLLFKRSGLTKPWRTRPPFQATFSIYMVCVNTITISCRWIWDSSVVTVQNFPRIPVPKWRQKQMEQVGNIHALTLLGEKSPLEQLLVSIKHEIDGNVTGIPWFQCWLHNIGAL